MCGIVGYVGKRPCRDLLGRGLEKLEYRGYDSAGISLLADGQIDTVRAVGNLANLRASRRPRRRSAGHRAARSRSRRRPATIGLGHTRWATHGRVTEENAHPHGDCADSVHIVLNGIVENHAELRRELTAEGHVFSSETDAEIVAHLIEKHYDGDLTEAVRAAFAELRGHYAFVAMHAEHPDTLVAARQECPLIVGLGEGETFVASAIPAFLAETRTVLGLKNGEIVTVDPEGARIIDADGTPGRARGARRSPGTRRTAEKGGYTTFMLKEIHEQPDAVAETIADRLPDSTRVDLSELELSDELIRGVAPDRDRRLRHLLPRRPRRSLRDRAVGAGPGRDGRRLRVPLPRPGRRPRRSRHRDHPVGRDRRHAGGDAARARAGRHGARGDQRHGQPGDPRRRRRALHPGRDSRSASPRRRPSSSQVAAMYLLGLWLAQARGHPRPGADRRADRRAQGPAAARSRRRCVAIETPVQRDRPQPPRAAASSSTSAATSASRSASRAR